MKVVAAIHSSMDMQQWIAYIQCIWQIFLRKAYCYFTGALAAIYLSGTVIISEGQLQWFNGYCVFLKQALAVKVFFKGIELIRNSSCSYPFNVWPFFCYKNTIAATHFFKLTMVLQNRDTAYNVFVFWVILVHIFPNLDWISPCTQSECGKMRTRITPNTDTFHGLGL